MSETAMPRDLIAERLLSAAKSGLIRHGYSYTEIAEVQLPRHDEAKGCTFDGHLGWYCFSKLNGDPHAQIEHDLEVEMERARAHLHGGDNWDAKNHVHRIYAEDEAAIDKLAHQFAMNNKSHYRDDKGNWVIPSFNYDQARIAVETMIEFSQTREGVNS